VESAGVVNLVDEAGKVGCNVLEGFVRHQIHGFDAKRGVKEKVANTGEKKGARCRRRGVNEDPVLS
jgi:hypothetical protein